MCQNLLERETIMPAHRNRYSAEFKAKFVQQMLREAQMINQLGTEHGIHPNELYYWREITLAGPPTGSQTREAAILSLAVR